jgi:DNA-binding MarR family transcriptional regulator
MTYANDMTAPTKLAKPTELAGAVRGAVMRLNRRLRRERPDNGLTLTQLSTLASLYTAGAMTPRELAETERVQPPSMTRIVAALEARGLVLRSAHPTDRRQVILAPTDAGAALIRESRRAREAWLAKQLAGLTPAERATLREATAILDRMASSP